MDNDLLLILLSIAALAARLGFCLYHAGLSQSKNAAAAVTRSLADFCVAMISFWAVGNAILMRQAGDVFGRHNSIDAWAIFVAVVAATATGAALGGTLERTKLLPSLCVSAILAGVIVPLSLRWAWSGWLNHLGFLDIGGASFVHLAAGVCAAAGAVISGPRQGKYNHDGSGNRIPGHSVPLAAAGVLAILIGLVCLLVGLSSQRPHPAPIAAAVDGLLAAAGGGLAAMAFAHIRYAITDFHLITIGMLAGIVSVSAGAGSLLSGSTSVVVGAAGGALAAAASVWIDLKWRIDDPANAVAIHAVGGIWSLVIGSQLYFPPPFLVQLAGIAVVGGMALAASVAIFGAFRLAGALRPGAADELDGADLVDHDLNAYPDFQQPTIKSHHLRQM